MDAIAIFEYGQKINIKCKDNQNMKEICQNFCCKVEKNINELIFLYQGESINFGLSFQEQAKIIGQNKKEINILVKDKTSSPNISYNFINSEERRNILEDQSVDSLFKNEERIVDKNENNIWPEKNINNKYIDIQENNINNNSITKNKTISLSNMKEIEIKEMCNYEIKECHCKKHHNENYTIFCKNCNKDMCAFCQKDHQEHELIHFYNIIIDENKLKDKMKENEERKDRLIVEIKKIINKLNNIIEKIDLDHNIKNSIINNFRFENRNYKVLRLLNIIYDNYSIFDDMNNIMRKQDIIINKFNDIIYKINNNKIEELTKDNTNIVENNNDIDIESRNLIEKLLNQDINNIDDNKNFDIINDYKIKNNEHINKEYNINKKEFQKIEEINEEILLTYKVDGAQVIKLFGKEFANKNKNKCSFIYNEKEYELTDKIDIRDNKKDDKYLQIRLKNFDKIEYISSMFEGCNSLISAKNLEKLNTSKFEDMSNIFYNCSLLRHISGISNWDTNNVKNMENMFYNCHSLGSLPDISNWITNNVTNMSGLFYGCCSLQSLPKISKWNLQNARDISSMFANCFSLKCLPEIDIWDVSNVKYLNHTFYNCSSLKKIPDLEKWDTFEVINNKGVFDKCKNLENIPEISDYNKNKVELCVNNSFKK